MIDLLLEIAGNPEAIIYDYKFKIQKFYKDMKYEEFEKKWSVTYFLLQDLKNVKKPEYTKLLRITSTWGNSDYHVYDRNLSPVIHNKELIQIILAISSIWGFYVEVTEKRKDIIKDMDTLYEQQVSQELKDFINLYCTTDNYFYIEDYLYKKNIYSNGKSNMGIDIYAIDVLIY